MVLADPGRVQANLFGPQRLGIDVLQELLGRARIVGVAVVAQREVAEFHGGPSWIGQRLRRSRLFVNANNPAGARTSRSGKITQRRATELRPATSPSRGRP